MPGSNTSAFEYTGVITRQSRIKLYKLFPDHNGLYASRRIVGTAEVYYRVWMNCGKKSDSWKVLSAVWRTGFDVSGRRSLLEKIENVAEMIMLLNGLKNVDVRDINYAGDNKGGMFNEAKELTDKCFDKTISLTGKIENIMDSYDIMDLTEEIIEEEALEFKEDEPNKGLKEYKTDLEKLWHENPNSLALQLNDLIGRSRKVRGGNKILKKETYEKLLIYKKNIEELPSPNGNNSDLYRTLENLKYKTVVEDVMF